VFDLWLMAGFIALVFGGIAHVHQTIMTIKKKASHLPEFYWWANTASSIILTVYALHLGDIIFIITNLGAITVNVINIFYYKNLV